eukprot:2847281-Pyramimonas_sp.AAC.1
MDAAAGAQSSAPPQQPLLALADAAPSQLAIQGAIAREIDRRLGPLATTSGNDSLLRLHDLKPKAASTPSPTTPRLTLMPLKKVASPDA